MKIIKNVKIKKDIIFYNLEDTNINEFKEFFTINDNDFKKYFYINNNDVIIKKNNICEYYYNDEYNWPSLIFNEECEIEVTIDENNFDEFLKII